MNITDYLKKYTGKNYKDWNTKDIKDVENLGYQVMSIDDGFRIVKTEKIKWDFKFTEEHSKRIIPLEIDAGQTNLNPPQYFELIKSKLQEKGLYQHDLLYHCFNRNEDTISSLWKNHGMHTDLDIVLRFGTRTPLCNRVKISQEKHIRNLEEKLNKIEAEDKAVVIYDPIKMRSITHSQVEFIVPFEKMKAVIGVLCLKR
ncbi:MAG: hypothetical protein ACQETL_19590 [Bacteroidota bacterium]